jgi:hypothetical protein
MGCWVSEESFQQPHLMYVEQWQSEEALQEHLRSDLYRRVLGTLELSRQRPEISFYFTSHERGLDLIEAARREGKRSNPVRAST